MPTSTPNPPPARYSHSFTEPSRASEPQKDGNPAGAVAEYLLRPLTQAGSHLEFTDYNTKKYPAFTVEETIPWRIRTLEFTVDTAIKERLDDNFLKEIEKIQWISKDLTYMDTTQASRNDFNYQMLLKNSHVFAELQRVTQPGSWETDPSWLSEDRKETANEIFDTYQTSMQDQSPQHRSMAAQSISGVLACRVRFANDELGRNPYQGPRHLPEDFVDPTGYDEIMKHTQSFITRRTWETQNLIGAAILKGNQHAYDAAMADLRVIKTQVERAIYEGYSPEMDEPVDYSNPFPDPSAEIPEPQFNMPKANLERGITLENHLYRLTDQQFPEQQELTPAQRLEHPAFGKAFGEFTAAMLPGDKERLVSAVIDNSQDPNPETLRERLNAISLDKGNS